MAAKTTKTATASATKAPRKVGPRTIDHLPLQGARDAAEAFIQRHRLLDDLHTSHTLNDIGAIIDAGNRLGLRTLGDLVDRAVPLLETTTGITQITRFLSRPQAETAHRHRNALAAVAAAAALAHRADPYPYLQALPALRTRHGGPQRAFTNDEVLLLRLWAIHQSRLGPRNRAAVFHLILTDAGARPSENTQIKPVHFNDPAEPSHVDLPGVNRVVGARRVPLPAWSRLLVREALRDHLARDEDARTRGVAYTGSADPGGHAASASACGVMARSIRDAGISGAPEPLGIVRWRIGTTKTQHGTTIAQQQSGYQYIDTMITFIGYHATEERPAEDLGRYATL